MNAMRKHVEELYEKIKEAFVGEEEEEQELYVDYIQGVLKNCSEYATLVAQQEQRIQVARFRMEPNDYREFVQNIDYNRRLAHNCLMKGVDSAKKADGTRYKKKEALQVQSGTRVYKEKYINTSILGQNVYEDGKYGPTYVQKKQVAVKLPYLLVEY